MDKKKFQIIGINALFLLPNKVGGTEYHLRSFIRSLEKSDKTNNYIIFCNRENYGTFEFFNKKWKKILCHVSAENRIERLLYEQIILPIIAQKYNCSILHSYGYIGPILGNFKKILTVHDCNWLDHPEDTSFLQSFILNVLISTGITTADKVITDSTFSYSRISHYFPKYTSKIHVIWPGIDSDFISLFSKSIKKTKYKKYILCVSALYPHKKMVYLLDLWKEISIKDSKIQLIVIGQNGRDESTFIKKLSGLVRTVYLSKVSFAELVAFYKHASLFIFPSVYEGFGYPVYEAYFSQLPIVVGNTKVYLESIAKQITQLSFVVKKDAVMILKTVSEKRKKKNVQLLPTYEKSTKELLQLMQDL